MKLWRWKDFSWFSLSFVLVGIYLKTRKKIIQNKNNKEFIRIFQIIFKGVCNEIISWNIGITRNHWLRLINAMKWMKPVKMYLSVIYLLVIAIESLNINHINPFAICLIKVVSMYNVTKTIFHRFYISHLTIDFFWNAQANDSLSFTLLLKLWGKLSSPVKS